MLLIPEGVAVPNWLQGKDADEEGDLVARSGTGEEAELAGLEPDVTDTSSQGERGSRLNHWLLFSATILEKCSSCRKD